MVRLLWRIMQSESRRSLGHVEDIQRCGLTGVGVEGDVEAGAEVGVESVDRWVLLQPENHLFFQTAMAV